jgi:hypothetical protein
LGGRHGGGSGDKGGNGGHCKHEEERGGCAGQGCEGRGSPNGRVDARGGEAVGTAALVSEAARAVVSGDGEGILQLWEVGGVPFCGSAGQGHGGPVWRR